MLVAVIQAVGWKRCRGKFGLTEAGELPVCAREAERDCC